ncbi:MAG: LptA/OstA family protein [Candidatus Omnitrophota bacterium]|jgi:hypothetical protein
MAGSFVRRMGYCAVVLLALSAFLVPGCSKKDAPKAPVSEAKDGKDSFNGSVKQKVLSFDLEGFTQKGTKSWEVKGESAEAISENQIKLDNIVAKAYGEEAEATITAETGVYDKSKNNVTLEKNVHATIDNTEMFAESYAGVPGSPAKEKKIAGEQKKRRISITCDGEVEFNYEKNQAYFNKNVKVKSEDADIDADKITINLEANTKKIKDIVAEGNVKIVRGENITYSDKATYVESEKKIILTGRPKLVISQEGTTEVNLFGN